MAHLVSHLQGGVALTLHTRHELQRLVSFSTKAQDDDDARLTPRGLNDSTSCRSIKQAPRDFLL